MKNRILPAVVWLTLILAATLSPGDQVPKTPDIIGFDKFIHLGLFLILTFLWHRTSNTGKKSQKLKKGKIITNYLVFGVLFAILVEYLQQHIPGRSFDYGDMIANITGGTFGTFCFYILHRRQSNLV
ncbi:MAG: VanZ family protein [Anditalea sp.]